MKELTDIYGRVVMINLINKHGYEAPLGESFALLASKYSNSGSIL